MRRSEPSLRCERARLTSALAPDVDPTELERRLLDAHLNRCPECAAFAAGVEAVTAAMRGAALVPLPYPIEIRKWRRRSFAHARNITATAAVALMALGLAALGQLPLEERGFVDRDVSRGSVAALDGQQELDEMRQVRRLELIAVGNMTTLPARHSGTQPA